MKSTFSDHFSGSSSGYASCRPGYPPRLFQWLATESRNCRTIPGVKAPARSNVAATERKDALVALLKEMFQFCDQTLATLDDGKLGDQLPLFGGKTMLRAAIETLTTGDWADHHSQVAIYLRLNGLLPPTATMAGM